MYKARAEVPRSGNPHAGHSHSWWDSSSIAVGVHDSYQMQPISVDVSSVRSNTNVCTVKTLTRVQRWNCATWLVEYKAMLFPESPDLQGGKTMWFLCVAEAAQGVVGEWLEAGRDAGGSQRWINPSPALYLNCKTAGIPAPIYFGAIIDTTCLKWSRRTCEGRRGACRIYDTSAYR